MDKLGRLKRLSQVNSSRNIRFLTPVAHPGSHCPMHTAVGMAASINGLSSLVIGARECGYYSRGIPGVANGNNGLHWTYAMDSDETVFGCKSGIIDSIKKMEKAGAEAIALITTCVPELIGEDLDAIINEAKPRISAKLIGVKAPQFNSNGGASGGLNFYEALAGFMEKRERLPRVVNLLGYDPAMFRRNQPPRLLQLLRKTDFDVRGYSTSTATVSDYAAASEAVLNILFSMSAIKLAEFMREKFDIPYIAFQDIYSVADIDDALLRITEVLGVDTRPDFSQARAEALALETESAEILRGKTFIMTYPFRDTLPLAAYLCGIGMEPLLINADDYCPHNARWVERILALGHDPFICHMVNQSADAAVLNSLPFDICIGRFKYIEDGRLCLHDMSNLWLTYDYSLTSGLLKMLIRMFHTIRSEA